MKTALTHLVLALVTLAVALSGYGWWYSMALGESARAASLLLEIERKAETTKRANDVEAALLRLEQSQGTVEEYFVSEGNVVAFLSELEELGSAAGAVIKVVSVSSPGGKGDPVLNISLSIEGSFDATMRTVGAIENAPYAISVTSLMVTERSTEAAQSWSASMIATVGSTAPK